VKQIKTSYALHQERRHYTPEKHYTAASHKVKKQLMEYFAVPEEHIAIVYEGVDAGTYHPLSRSSNGAQQRQALRQQWGFEEQDFVVLHAAPLTARSGIFSSLQVLSYLNKNDFKRVRLLTLTPDPNPRVEEAVKNLNLEDHWFPTPPPVSESHSFWAADCLFAPTYYEPFGTPILQAMACGLPVVASEAAGASELITPGKNGLLCDPWASTQELANSLLPLLRDPQWGQNLAKQGLQLAEQQPRSHEEEALCPPGEEPPQATCFCRTDY
jgi:UDP-glucose:(heptosyl)LPS alpha-1,3-glucosyltransferase